MSADDHAHNPDARGMLFPSMLAVHLLAVGFVATRVFVGVAQQRPWLAGLGSFTSIAGSLLALVAVGRALWLAPSTTPWHALDRSLRGVSLLAPAALVFAAMGARIPHVLQGVTVASASLYVLATGVRAVARARGAGRAPGALAALTLGEFLELVHPPSRMAAAPGSVWPRVALQVGLLSELLAFVGVPLALAWCVQATSRAVGAARTAVFLVMPFALAVVLAVLPVRLPITCSGIARASFGARFDLVGGLSVGHPHPGLVTLYSLMLSGLLAASTVSLAGQTGDRDGAPLRAFGWMSILLGGFGRATVAGSVDPMHLVAVLFGFALLERAAALESPRAALVAEDPR